MIQKNKKTMIKEKGKEICQRVLDTNIVNVKFENYYRIKYNSEKEGYNISEFSMRRDYVNKKGLLTK